MCNANRAKRDGLIVRLISARRAGNQERVVLILGQIKALDYAASPTGRAERAKQARIMERYRPSGRATRGGLGKKTKHLTEAKLAEKRARQIEVSKAGPVGRCGESAEERRPNPKKAAKTARKQRARK